MTATPELVAGFAEVDVTPAPGLSLLGQMHERIAQSARDPLLVNAVALRQGDEAVVLVSIDTAMVFDEFVAQVQPRFAQATGLPAARLIVNATHTHVAPSLHPFLTARTNPAFVATVQDAVVTAASHAVQAARPMRVYAGTGHMAEMGWNRRAMYENGTSRMYGNSSQPGFIGMEGPRDPALGLIWFCDENDAVQGVIINFATHPNCIEAETVYSADIPGAVRARLKQLHGAATGVVYLTGAAGNTAPSILDPWDETQPWRGHRGLERSGHYMAGEAAKVMAATLHPMEAPVLRVAQASLAIALRTWPATDDPTYPEPISNLERWIAATPYYQKAEAEWDTMVNPVATRVNVIRIGDAVICTNPAELFVEFGLEMREASPARVTLVSELTDGYVGYVPTELALARGGYETWPAPSSKLAPEAGAQIVEKTAALMNAVFAS